ncbi:MAG: hypothetical protein C4316_04315 [Chloroflexota bacterium]
MGRLTLEALARARGLSPDLLRQLGWAEDPDGVAIPWPTSDGRMARHHRHTLERDGDRKRWTWTGYNRTTILPYGADRLGRMCQKAPDAVVIVESEVDAVALWTAGIPAIATGGADGWQGRWWGLLQGFQRVVVWLEDAGGLPLLRRLLETRPADGPKLLVCHGLGQPGKDPGRILAARNGGGREILRRIVDRAVPVETVPDLLRAVVERLRAKRQPGGSYSGRCPFHDDRHPSLSIFKGDDGAWAFRCHSGRCGEAGPLALLAATLGLVEAPLPLPTIDRAVGSEVMCQLPNGKRERPPLRAYTTEELLALAEATANPPSLPVLGRDGLIIRGWSHLLAAPPKAGKTELLLACVRDWCAQGTLVHWLSEESAAIWGQRLARTGPVPNMQITPAQGADPADILAHARAIPADVVIVDTIRNLLRVDELDNARIATVLGEWEAALADRTRVYVHHSRKGGGEHGEAVAGGFAFVGAVDRVLEIRRDPRHDRRRLLVGESRLLPVSPLVYEQTEDGRLVALGDPQAVELEATQDRVLAVLSDGERWTTRDVHEALDNPRPSLEQVRQALTALARAGRVERDPPLDQSAQGRTVRWRLLSSTSLPTAQSIVGSEVGSAEVEAPARPYGMVLPQERDAKPPTEVFEVFSPTTPANRVGDDGFDNEGAHLFSENFKNRKNFKNFSNVETPAGGPETPAAPADEVPWDEDEPKGKGRLRKL